MNSRKVGVWRGLVLTGLWGWLVAITQVFAEDLPAFQVRLTTREIESTSQFEVVFEKPMVAADQIGMPDVSSPLRIDPPVPGDFVWRSRRVGVFQPKEPLRLGTAYVFQPRSGLRDAEGKLIASRLRREIRTPELSFQIDSGDRFRSGSLGALPAVLVSANATLNPQDLAARCVFQDGTSRIQARVEPVDFEDWEGSHPGFAMPALTWVDRFLKAPMASTTNTPKRESGAAFWVRPMAPLVSESPWVLRVGRGVRSADGRTRLASDVEAQLGISLPFTLAARKTDSSVEVGRQIQLEFSRPLVRSLATNWNQWIGLSPEVPDIQGSVSGNVLSLRGGFHLNQKYDIEVDPGLRSEDGVPFSSDSSGTNVLQFEPISPRVWLPGYSEVQLLAGHRDFEVRSLNTPSVRLRVKALSRAGLIPALAGYERMRSASWDASRNPAPLEYAALAGRTVLETNLVVQERVDEVVRIPMGWDALVGAGRPGAFFVEVETPKGAPKGASGPQTLVQLTDLGFVAKSGAERTWVWVVSQKTSQPLKGVTVSLCDSEDGTLVSGVTDERGLVVLPKQEAAKWWVLELGADIHVAPVGVGGVSAWGQGLPDGHWGSGPLAIWSFTDREAYRPGDRIHLHGQLRRWDGRDWQLPQVDVVELTVGDPRGQVVLKTNLTVTALGSCEWQGVLPEGSRGSHDLTLVSGNALWTGSIEVREFQPPAFEVRVALPQEIAVGQPLSASVEARYLLGAPVTRGRLQWHAEAVDLGFEPEGWDDFLWLDPDRDTHSNPEAAQVHQTGSVALTSAEPIRIEADLPGHPTRPGPQLLRLTAEVTDPNQQTVSQMAEKIRQASDFYLGFRWAGGRESVQTTNHPLAFQVVASRPDGSPWTNAVAVRATLRRIEWKTVVVERAGGKLAHEQRRDLEDVGTRSLKTSAVVKRGILWCVAEGQAPEEGFRVERPGAYELSLEATDGSGRPVRTVVELHVEGDGRLAWHWHNGSRLGLVPDRSTLASGEPARLLVEAPFNGTALVTVEREEVREAFVTRITGNAPSIEVPFTNSLAPNAMVGVFLMRGLDGNPHQHPMPEWRAGWVNFDIPDPDRRLAVEVGLGASPAQPGQEMPVTVSIRTAAGLPAAGAEVTLYAVDEGFLQLMGTRVPDPVAFWGAARPLRVFTTQSFRSLLEEDPELLEFSNKGDIGGGGGRRGLSQRRRFIPCPLWEGSRVADEQGRVTSTFVVPDSLTRYRVVAVATHGVRRFGSSSSTFEVRKPLMVESGLPRFLHVGDRLEAQALVLNGTTNDIEARVSLKVPSAGITLEGGEASRVVRIPAGASVPVSFPIQATASSDAEWTWRAEPVGSSAGNGAGDEVVVRLPVTRGVPDLVTAVWSRAGRSGTNLLAAMDPAVLESPRSAVVRVATGPLGFAGASIDWLARYPYGCVEQTSSMLVPWIAALRFPGLLGQVDSMAIRMRIAEGVRQLWAMQLGSGMLSSWPGGSDTADWGSVYAAWVLTRAAEAGVDVGSSRRERLLQALSEACRSGWVDQRRDDGSLASFVAMVLADSGRSDPSLNAVLLDKAEGLTPTSRAFLAWALALQDPADDALRAKAVALLNPVAASSKRNRARSLEDYWDPARLPAVRLLAGQKLGVDAATAERDLVALISEARRGFWSTTQGNAWALWAMASIAPVVPEAGVEGVLKQGGHDVPFQITAKNPVIRWQFPMEASAVAGGIQVRSGSDQTLLVQAQVTAEDRADPTRTQAVDRGLGIQRTYQRLDDENRPGPLEGLRVGDRVLVTLRVDVPEDLDWLAIEDPIPSVLEPIQGVFRTSAGASHPLIPAWSSDFQEVRGDRVRHFKDHVPDGVHWIRYVARVRSAGDVVAPPARAEAMYDPDRFGQSAGGRLQSAP